MGLGALSTTREGPFARSSTKTFRGIDAGGICRRSTPVAAATTRSARARIESTKHLGAAPKGASLWSGCAFLQSEPCRALCPSHAPHETTKGMELVNQLVVLLSTCNNYILFVYFSRNTLLTLLPSQLGQVSKLDGTFSGLRLGEAMRNLLFQPCPLERQYTSDQSVRDPKFNATCFKSPSNLPGYAMKMYQCICRYCTSVCRYTGTCLVL
jgi:hypothetical protein